MGISGAINNALTGLTANARMAEVVSSNLSNALTDGYGRRSVELSSVQVGDRGGGVRINAINRFVDAGLLADRRLADAALNGQERNAAMLVRLQQSMGGPDDAASLVARLAEFEGALINAGGDPASETRLATVVARLDDVVTTLRDNTKTVQGLREEADSAIARDVETLNRSLKQVADLNRDILRISDGGNDPSALLDARQQAIDQIAKLVPTREVIQQNGTVGLMTTTGVTLLDSEPTAFTFERTPTITADMTYASGALGGLSIGGIPGDPNSAIGRLDGGAIGASFAMRDQTLFEVQASLDVFAADLVARFQDPANDQSLAAGDAGLLTDQGALLDLADTQGLAGRVTLNTSIDPSVGGNPNLLRDGLNAITPVFVGDNFQIISWIAALSDARADVLNSGMQSAEKRAALLTEQIAMTRLRSDEELGFTTARWETLRVAELAGGVDTDQELQKLLQIEQAYAANARVIETADFLMQRLLEI
jgi:flagellar hook-associated protein 1 FlgK